MSNSVEKFRESVNYEVFLTWVSGKLEYREGGEEVKINSLFTEDYKFKLYCNPKKNAYHCWKSGKSGSLVNLVMLIDKCDYHTACSILGVGNRLRTVDADVEKFMAENYPEPPPPPPKNAVNLPGSSYLISDMSDMSPHKQAAKRYLDARQMPLNGFYYCTDGKYRDRIIIPYYGPLGDIQYWNGRDVTGDHYLRYWGPGRKECGIGKEDVVYFYKWPEPGQTVVLTEGEFDAISLTLSGLYGAAVSGKEIGSKQIDILRNYKICLSFDNDKFWKSSLSKIGHKFLRDGISLSYVSPPVGYKDWNDLLVGRGGDAIKKYVEGNQKEYNQWSCLGI